MKNTQVWTALITPMKDDGTIHYSDLEKLVRRQEKTGNGILMIGSTGEGLALSGDEKLEVIKFVSDLNPEVPVMAGVGGFNLEEQKKWISTCNKLNVDAFLLVTPLYAKPGLEGQVHWFKSLLDTAEKPCMLYNIPSRTGVDMNPEVLIRLKGHENLWAVKEASGSVHDFKAFRHAAPDVSFFSGDDAMVPFFSVAGCAGLVSVSSNVWPEATKLYVHKCLAGKSESSLAVWDRAVQALFSAANPTPAKLLLKEKGIIESAAVKPPLVQHELKDLSELLNADKEIENWYNLNKN